MKRIPFVPFPIYFARKLARPLFGVGGKLTKFFSILETNLEMAEMELKAREYLAIALLSSFFWFGLILLLSVLSNIFLTLPDKFMIFSPLFSVLFGVMSFMYIVFYPKLLINRKVRELEKNLIFVLRHLLIQIKSGVPLFDSMISVANGNYGLISKEFAKTVDKISTGTSEIEALEELTYKNPSLYFRRTIWQLTNAFKSGADLGRTLENIVASLSTEQKLAVKTYGSQLNPLAMMYMMIAVIVPTLGTTFLIILSSFSGFPISKTTFWIILGGVAFFQFSFVGIVKSRRPAIEL